MASKYLDNAGLTYFWGKLKAYFQPKLVSGTNIKTINNQSLLGSGNIAIEGGGGGGGNTFFGDCTTAAETAQKDVVCSDFTASNLLNGTVLYVRFRYGHTSTSNPSLDVNDTGNHVVAQKYTSSATGAVQYEWAAGEILCFVYYEGRWVIVDAGKASTTYYGFTKLSSSIDSTSTATAATSSAVRTAYKHADDAYDLAGQSRPTILFDNPNASVGNTVTLTSSAANFKRLKIFFKTGDEIYSSVDVAYPNNKMVSLMSGTPIVGTTLYLKARVVTINGSSIATASFAGTANTCQVPLSSTLSYMQGEYIAITQVLGYDEL